MCAFSQSNNNNNNYSNNHMHIVYVGSRQHLVAHFTAI